MLLYSAHLIHAEMLTLSMSSESLYYDSETEDLQTPSDRNSTIGKRLSHGSSIKRESEGTISEFNWTEFDFAAPSTV